MPHCLTTRLHTTHCPNRWARYRPGFVTLIAAGGLFLTPPALTAGVPAREPNTAAPGESRSPAVAQTDSYRFNVPPGSLEDTIAAFETVTGLHVVIPADASIRALASPGVVGTYTAERALEQLVAGTGLTFRLSAARTYALEVHIAAETVEVSARLTPHRAEQSASATKTTTPLLDIPQTINVLPRALLVDRNVQSIAEAVRNVPGVSVAQGEGNRDQIVLRGISTLSDFFVNGVRDDQERFRDMYNVESIEVVQGPAAVLFGRGGAGGIVNLVTRKPTRGVPSEFAVDLGSYGHRRATGQVTAPIGDRATFGASIMSENSAGFRDAYFLHRYGFNPTVAVGVGKATNVTIGFEHLHDRRLADRGIPSQAGRPAPVSRTQLFGSSDQNDARSDVDSLSTTIEHRFRDNLTLRNSVLAGRYDKFYQNVYPGSAVSAANTFTLSAYNHDIDRTNVFNQTDLVYDAKIGGMQHALLFGVELGRQAQDELRHTAATIANVPLSDSIRNANFGAAPLVIDRRATADIAAGYVQDQIALTPHWKAVAGARTDYFRVQVDDHLPGNPDLARSDMMTSPRVGLIYQPVSTTSIYGSYSYTFLPSGQTLGLAVNTAQLEPENAKNYEVGVKRDLASGRVNISAALFRLDRNNVKNTNPNDSTQLVLTGQQRTDGVVLSVAGNLLPRWRVYGGYANLNARIVRDTASAPAGRRVGLVPRNQLTWWSSYDVTNHWTVAGGVLSQTKTFASFSNQIELPGFTRVDGAVSYRLHNYRIGLNVDNLFDATYYPTANGDNNISPGAPRSLQVTIRAMF